MKIERQQGNVRFIYHYSRSHITHSIAGPPPITTTSLIHEPNIRVEQFMDNHQKYQGYTPSLSSMMLSTRTDPSLIPQSALFSNTPSEFHQSKLNPQNPYPRKPGKPSQMPVSMMDPKSQMENTRLRPIDPARDGPQRNLRPVDVPADVLKRFMAVSAANTELNKETLGLLMGKYKSNKYVVTTLLIPRQRTSSDWCIMEDEETVLSFQEKRFLVTLGWVSSSFDGLSGQQLMLPFLC